MFGPSRRDLHRQLERERARNQQRESDLLDRIMLLTGKPWTLPPRESEPANGDGDEYDLIADPSQLPDY